MNLSRCCWGSVDDKTKSLMDRGSVKHLSSRQRARKIGSMDWRSCQDSIKKKPRNLNGLRICRDAIEKVESTWIFFLMDRGSVEVSIEAEERKLNRNESIEDLSRSSQTWKNEFFKGGKIHKDECNKQAPQPKIQSTY